MLLHERIPELAQYHELVESTGWCAMKSTWARYCQSVSDFAMALSWETSCFLYVLCNVLNPKNILDLGSGFSSVVFRTWAKYKRVCITSVDNDRHWLIKTRKVLKSLNLGSGGLTCLQPCELKQLPGKYDLVFYDYGTVPVRARCFDIVKCLVAPGGVMVMDDMHMLGLGHLFWTDLIAPDSGFKFYSAREYTLDNQYRFSDLAWKEED